MYKVIAEGRDRDIETLDAPTDNAMAIKLVIVHNYSLDTVVNLFQRNSNTDICRSTCDV